MKLRIGTRGSALARWQANHVAERLRAHYAPELDVEILTYKTTGDHILDRPLAEIGGKGLFTKELEVAIEEGAIDLAVHSLKDMPTVLPAGMTIAAIPKRADVRDCVLTRVGDTQPPRIIGTASLRRACLAGKRWSHARSEPIRGNVLTRMNRLFESGERRVDAVILAMAGMIRLGYPEERTDIDFLPLNPEHWIPAVGQGALAIECREDDTATRDLLSPIHHEATSRCTAAERTFLRAVEGDCRVPVGAYATADGTTIRLKAFVGDPETLATVVHTALGDDPEQLGQAVADEVLSAGGHAMLERLRQHR
ncbi:MAG: hydroxymethylbilane synthase [Myxococcota bacterium]|nr:hydroxymethylbilane synthase [Myxococcota bacterium]